MNIYDLIIVGSGPTGLYASYFALSKKMNILVIESSEEIGGAPIRLYPDKPLYDIPGHLKITGYQLVNNMIKQLDQYKGCEFKTSTLIKSISINNKNIHNFEIETNNGNYKTKNILFATGYGSFTFNTFKFEINNKVMKHIHHFVPNKKHFENKHIVICGGGDSAIDYANLLYNNAKSISIIHRRNEFRAKEANVEAARKNCLFLLNKDVINIDKQYLYIIDNETNEKQQIKYDEILVLYGTKPLPNSINIDGLFNKQHKIDVNENCEAIAYKHIYACGLATTRTQQQTIITGIADAIRAVDHMYKNLKNNS